MPLRFGHTTIVNSFEHKPIDETVLLRREGVPSPYVAFFGNLPAASWGNTSRPETLPGARKRRLLAASQRFTKRLMVPVEGDLSLVDSEVIFETCCLQNESEE